jgi:carbamoyltransferase
MIYWGINALNHGSSIAVVGGAKNLTLITDQNDRLSSSMVTEAINASHYRGPERIFWYERPWVKKFRQLYAGQYKEFWDRSVLPRRHVNDLNIRYAPITYTPHHASHAAAGYYTSPFNHCAVVVLDAIGEFECASIWEGRHGELTKLWSKSYPNSLGLFYSAFTELLGMKPIRDEYLLQQLSEQGNRYKHSHLIESYFDNSLSDPIEARVNFHLGVPDWPFEIRESDRADIAAGVQEVFENQVMDVMLLAKRLTKADCLVYMGGCAFNSLANQRVVEPLFPYRWSTPNPGDAYSSLGAVLYHTKHRVILEKPLVKHLEVSV